MLGHKVSPRALSGPHNPDRYDLLTPANVKALAHPIRLTILRLLREDGPATASRVGERIGQSSGVTS